MKEKRDWENCWKWHRNNKGSVEAVEISFPLQEISRLFYELRIGFAWCFIWNDVLCKTFFFLQFHADKLQEDPFDTDANEIHQTY